MSASSVAISLQNEYLLIISCKLTLLQNIWNSILHYYPMAALWLSVKKFLFLSKCLDLHLGQQMESNLGFIKGLRYVL